MNIFLLSVRAEISLNNSATDKNKGLSLGHYPPLGLMYLAAYLHEHTAHRAQILDTEVESLSEEELIGRVLAATPDAVGFYTTSFNIHIVYRILRKLRAAGFSKTVILGGPHIDLYPQETAALPEVDIAVTNEGEITLAELLDSIELKRDLASVKGILYKIGGVVTCTPPRPLITDLDSLPLPARRLTEFNRYYSVAGRDKISTTLMTSRGCPFRCNFCFIQYNGRYRIRSAQSVIKEIEDCISLGIREFFFFDEIFTFDPKRVTEICDSIIARKLNISFTVRSRVDTIDQEMIYKLKAAGAARIQYGVESGSEEILKAMNKRITPEQVRRTVQLTKMAGLEVLLDFMIGYPGETEEQINKTVAFAKELDPDYAIFGITTFLPGIKIYADALHTGAVKDDFWRNLAINPTTAMTMHYASDKFTRSELISMRRKAHLSFYFRPKYILNRLNKISSPTALLRQARAGWHLLTGR